MPAKNNNKHPRYALVDLLRGIAIAMMFTYHFAWDLNTFNYIRLDFYHDPFWLHYRTVIVSMFLLVMGISLYLAHHKKIVRYRFLVRLYWLIGCSLIITISTYFYNGERFIYFGILHFITLASVLGLLFVRYYWLNLILGLVVIAMGNLVQCSLFNPRVVNWIGFVSNKPQTDDYVPLFPWFGVVLLGIFLARWAYQAHPFPLVTSWQGHSAISRLLQFGGRHSLIIYMLHQPVFIGILTLVDVVS